MEFTRIEAKALVVDGDHAAIHYVFEMNIRGTDKKARLEEIAWQVWKNGVIVSERYFYDPAQRVPK